MFVAKYHFSFQERCCFDFLPVAFFLLLLLPLPSGENPSCTTTFFLSTDSASPVGIYSVSPVFSENTCVRGSLLVHRQFSQPPVIVDLCSSQLPDAHLFVQLFLLAD